jgi:4-hydroxybenzoate polyprenyltransferase
MIKYLRIYRPLNLLFIGIAQWLCVYRLDVYANLQSIYELGIYPLIGGTIAVAAFGYWVNDFYDIERDRINKPEKRTLWQFPKWLSWVHFVLFIGFAVSCGLLLNYFFLGLFMFCIVLLWLYSMLLKDSPGIGNALIAILSFLSIYMLKWQFVSIDPLLLIHFAALAGLLNFSREVVKDGEDIEGDKELGAKTIPIVFGKSFANKIVHFILLFTISFIAISLYYQRIYFKPPMNYLYWGYYLLFVIIPLYKLAVDVRYGEDAEDYARFSMIIKYVLYTGILSILFF